MLVITFNTTVVTTVNDTISKTSLKSQKLYFFTVHARRNIQNMRIVKLFRQI